MSFASISRSLAVQLVGKMCEHMGSQLSLRIVHSDLVALALSWKVIFSLANLHRVCSLQTKGDKSTSTSQL